MHILFSSTSTIDCCNGKFYNNAVKDALPRYHYLGKYITCLAFRRNVTDSKQEQIDDPYLDFVFLEKINSIKSLLVDKKENERIIEQAVKKSDICVAHVPSYLGEATARIAKKHHKPCLNIVVGCPWDSYWNYSFKGKLMAPFRYFSLRKTQREAAYSIYVTNEFLQRRYPTKGYSIGCSDVAIDIYDESILKERLNSIFKNNKNKIKMATLAAVDVRYKGQEYVIRALPKLKQMGIDVEYHLVGGGDDSFLRSLADKLKVSDIVFFHGLMPHRLVLLFLDNMDLYIQPSKQEGLPRALIEAMSRGCLALGSRTGGIPELLEEKFLFRCGNVEDIVHIIAQINSNILMEQAVRNIEMSKQYNPNILKEKWYSFMNLFKQDVVL